jgi:hypothetical protein
VARPNRARKARSSFAQPASPPATPSKLAEYVGWDPRAGRYRDPLRDWKEAQRHKRPA